MIVASCSSLLIVQVGGLILPVTFNLAIGLAAKVVPLDNANKEIANKYFFKHTSSYGGIVIYQIIAVIF